MYSLLFCLQEYACWKIVEDIKKKHEYLTFELKKVYCLHVLLNTYVKWKIILTETVTVYVTILKNLFSAYHLYFELVLWFNCNFGYLLISQIAIDRCDRIYFNQWKGSLSWQTSTNLKQNKEAILLLVKIMFSFPVDSIKCEIWYDGGMQKVPEHLPCVLNMYIKSFQTNILLKALHLEISNSAWKEIQLSPTHRVHDATQMVSNFNLKKIQISPQRGNKSINRFLYVHNFPADAVFFVVSHL